jgi:hypothetical protein
MAIFIIQYVRDTAGRLTAVVERSHTREAEQAQNCEAQAQEATMKKLTTKHHSQNCETQDTSTRCRGANNSDTPETFTDPVLYKLQQNERNANSHTQRRLAEDARRMYMAGFRSLQALDAQTVDIINYRMRVREVLKDAGLPRADTTER